MLWLILDCKSTSLFALSRGEGINVYDRGAWKGDEITFSV